MCVRVAPCLLCSLYPLFALALVFVTFLLAATMSWSKITATGTTPSARRAHSANAMGSVIYVFGGGDGSTALNEIYAFDTGS